MRFGQLLMRFCRSQTVALGLSVTRATLMIVALLSPANAQFWGDSWGWGGRQQQRQQPYNPFGGSWSDRPGASGAIGRWKALGTRVRRNGLGKQRGRNHQITPARRRPRPERMPRSRLW